jgi:SSS family solute:Na+ symporter
MDVSAAIMVIIYLGVIIGIGVYLSRFVKAEDDFWLAGRTLGPWVTAFSYTATWYSAVALVGSPAFIYGKGLAMGVWTAFGATWLFVIGPTMALGVPLRRMSERLNAVTIPEWIGARFDSRLLTGLAALCIAVFFIPYITAITKGAATVFQVFVNIPYIWGVIVTGIVVAIYMTLSGYYGACWTDFIQGWIMIVALTVTLITALVKVGGIGGAVSALQSIDPKLVAPSGGLPWPMFISMAFVWGFVTWGQPQMLVRFLGLKSPRQMKTLFVVAAFASLFIIFPCYMLGVLGKVFYPTEFVKRPDLLIPSMLKDMMPLFFVGFFLCAVIAATMSTMDSIVLVATSSVVRDIYERLILLPKGTVIDHVRMLKISRVVCVVILALGILLAIKPPGIIWSISVFAVGSIAATITASILYGVFWRRANWQGSLASMIVGFGVTMLWYGLEIKFMHPYLVGMIFSHIAFPVFALMFPPPSKELVERAYGTKLDRRMV